MSPPLAPAPYRTTDFYLACYLTFLKTPLRAVEPVGPSRVVFVFDPVPEATILGYYNREPIGACAFIDVVEAIRHMRELLYHGLERNG